MNASSAALGQSANPAQALREVRRGVAQAGDAQVLQVVRMVDALEDRGATDAVLEPVRGRLRAIQPARPLRFARLLFMPLDPLIVAPSQWRPATPFLPRTALMVLSRTVRQAMALQPALAECLPRIDSLIAGTTTAQIGIVRQAGELLWPRAAGILRELGTGKIQRDVLDACAAEWGAEGLSRTELQPLATALAPILAQSLALHDHDHSGSTLTDQALLDMLGQTEAAGPRACGMMLSLLVIRVPQSAPALLAAAQRLASLRTLTEAAADTALSWVETETADQTGSIGEAAATELVRQTALLEALTDQSGNATRRRRVAEIKTHLLTGCLHRFETSLQDQVIGPLNAIPADPTDRDAALDVMESTARTLRRFELEARRLGAGAKFDSLVGEVGKVISATPGLSPMDRARLMEIVAGPDAATRLLPR